MNEDKEVNKGGRPAIYDDPEKFAAVADEYFAQCVEKKERPTITGLTLHMGFADKSTLYDYRDRDVFSHSVKKAILQVENAYESALHGAAVAGPIFALKNMGWKDKTEIDSNNTHTVTWQEERTYDDPLKEGKTPDV